MTRQVLVKSFNDLLRRFSKDVSSAYAASTNSLAALHNSIVLFSNTCPDICVSVFHRKVNVPFAQYIKNRDEKFFLSNEFSFEIAPDENYLNVNIEDLILQLRDVWCTLEPSDKDSVWQYLEALIALSGKISG